MKELKDFTSQEILEELIKRDQEGDNMFYIFEENPTSYKIKFWKFD